PEGKERLRAAIALCFAALSLPGASLSLRHAVRQLEDSLDHQIFADGGHISRNPLAVVELLSDLLPLKQTFLAQTQSVPPLLLSAIDRMMPAVRFFRHRDGALARFNGMGATAHDRLSAVLQLDETNAAPVLSATHSGYERLA
ncbi:heparinase, partial [Escherichia coli]|nr:heparinase [Escherichia coli]